MIEAIAGMVQAVSAPVTSLIDKGRERQLAIFNSVGEYKWFVRPVEKDNSGLIVIGVLAGVLVIALIGLAMKRK